MKLTAKVNTECFFSRRKKGQVRGMQTAKSYGIIRSPALTRQRRLSSHPSILAVLRPLDPRGRGPWHGLTADIGMDGGKSLPVAEIAALANAKEALGRSKAGLNAPGIARPSAAVTAPTGLIVFAI